MANINIYGDLDSGSIFFINSTVDPKSLGTVVASLIDHNGEDRILVERNDRFQSDGVTSRVLFKKLNPNRVQNRNGEELVGQLGYTVQQVIDYINGQSQLTGSSGGDGTGTDVTDLSIDFKLDNTSTSVMLDNGYAFGVNTIKAVAGEDGLINVISEQGDLVYFTKLDHTNVTVNGAAVSGGLNDVVNTLNELFSVGAFESVVISDPYSTMVADVAGVVDGGALVGSNAIDPVGTDILAASSSHYNRTGWVSEESIDQAGEYFTFDIRVTDSMGFGLILDQGADKYGVGSYADPDMFCNDSTSNSANWGYYWSHWFHSGNKGPWTYYGQRTSSSIREGWGAFSSSDERVDYLADAPVKMKVGIDANGYMEVSWYDVSESTWRQVQRSSYVIEEGESLKLGIKVYGTRGRLHTTPKKHLLEPAAPTMQFRYIESPDGEFHYPLFATAEEANYYDEITNGLSAGTGASHTHTYVDDPTGTTWYMAGASHDAGYTPHTSAPSATTFSGNTVTYTEVTSLSNADLTPTQFGASNITQEEGTNVNIQVTPAGATWSSSVSISPSGSGLVYDGYSLVQGTLADVGADTVYTITVTRANSYGSSVGTMTVTATDVPVASSLTTPWNKAVVINGANEYLKMVNVSNSFNPINMGGTNNDVWGANNGKTSTDTDARPWSISQVVYIDNSQSQCYFSQGENLNNDRISLSTHETGANSKIEFYWGRSTGTGGANSNGVQFLFDKPADGWYGYYIDSTGFRPNQAQSTTTALATNFRFKQVDLSTGTVTDITGTWAIVGDGRLNRGLYGSFYVGREFDTTFSSSHSLKVASTLISTLKRDYLLPDDTEISMQVRDPQQWVIDYRDGTQQRIAYNNNNFDYDTYPERCVQLWLMGDGASDSYSNNVRNDVKTADQNYTMLRLQNMVSNDIQTVNINGLT